MKKYYEYEDGALEYVPEALKTKERLQAVRKDGFALKYAGSRWRELETNEV